MSDNVETLPSTVLLQEPERLFMPVLPLRDIVVFPRMIVPLFVGRPLSVRAVEFAMVENQKIFMVAQHKISEENLEIEDLYSVGTVGKLLQLLRLPDGTLKVLIEGETRARAERYSKQENYISVELEMLEYEKFPKVDIEFEGLVRALINQFDQYVKLNRKIPSEVMGSLGSIEDMDHLADTVAAHLTLKTQERQQVLECLDTRERIKKLLQLMEVEIDILQVERKVRNRVKKQMEKNQREYYLNEQMKAIQKELGELSGQGETELESLGKKISATKMPKVAQERVTSEFRKLKLMSPLSSESTVCRNYIDWMLQVPWFKQSPIKKDIVYAQKVLNNDHYGLEKVKERILEYLAVQQRVNKMKGPILCLVGPPGVGKTSLGASAARATGRKFVRVALGGLRDEAEIRGHRRTYIGSMPGKIIQKLVHVETRNPLFLLDEVDKMAADFRGDPGSALLEVLDPEQNHEFSDNYLELPFNLSNVMFMATANSVANIPLPLLDRMEVIRLEGYTEDEKVEIALRYLLPKHIKNAGLKSTEIEFSPDVPLQIIRYYTREAGVRSLEREIAKICRRVVKKIQLKQVERVTVSVDSLEDLLGVKKVHYGVAAQDSCVGRVTGLAWTEVGGELLKIECAVVPGKGSILSTGKLGEVMQESVKAALTVVRRRTKFYKIAPDFYEKSDIHVHVPEGATPKDGPSAGIAICTALVSSLAGLPVRADVAMTGEITLLGEVLSIGGLKEKLLAARRAGIRTVIIPEENAPELKEIPSNITAALDIIPVKWIDQVLDLALFNPTLKESVKADV